MTLRRHGVSEGILFTDLYQLTMAQAYFRAGAHMKNARFDYFFRKNPDYGMHQSGYSIFAGLESFLEWAETARLNRTEVEFLKRLKTTTGRALFTPDFIRWFSKHGAFDGVRISAVPEGRVVHPNVPIAIVEGPLAQAQLIETALLNKLNYQTLVATRASRIREAAQGRMMIEFGLRRAQGTGGNEGTRAALIGGADFSSNVGASCELGFPPKGTHAHSLVQAFMALGYGELGAFRMYADVYPDDCLLLVDTINTLESGVPNAIKVFEELKRKGHRPIGIRLDSGDLAYLSIHAHKMLSAAGFPDVSIVLSNQLDEIVISQILLRISEEASVFGVDPDAVARRLTFGVGARLLTSEGCSALDGVYKLSAIEQEKDWRPSIKLSESPAKTLNPGRKKVWRLYDRRQKAVGDLIALEDEHPENETRLVMRHPLRVDVFRRLNRSELSEVEPLLTRVYGNGKRLRQTPPIAEIRRIRDYDLARLDLGVKRLINPHIYHVSLSEALWELKQSLIEAEKGSPAKGPKVHRLRKLKRKKSKK